ncbi:MAG: 2'-5' RNA ligase family protein [Acidimicrobiales bacterium]
MRESALSFVIDHPDLASVPYCRENRIERGLVPHLTVLYPWGPAPVGIRTIERAAEVVAGTGSINMHFDRLDTFESGVVYAALTEPGPVVELMRRVAAAFPDTPPYGGAHAEPVPHLTLGRCSPSDLAATVADVAVHTRTLLPFEVQLHELGVLEQDLDGRWSVTGAVSLL